MQRRVEVTHVIRPFLFLIITLLADQATKIFVRTYPGTWQGTFFRFTENDTMVFSIPVPDTILWGLIGAAVLFLGIVLFEAIRHKRRERMTPLLLVIVGGASNVIDRIRFGAVTDVFVFPGGLFFNIADCMIIIGIILFVYPWHSRSSLRQS